jgi:glycosyltransferase involved in cell wall biosynthesis
MKHRVLHIIDSLDLGGAQTALLNFARHLDRDRWELEVACMHGHGVFWQNFVELGVPISSLSPARWLPLYVWRLARLLGSRRFAIVHCRLFGSNWIAKPIAAALGVPVLITHDECNDRLRYDNPLALWWDRAMNRLSDHVCAVSNSTRDFLLQHEGLPEDRVSVVYNGIDCAHFDRSTTPANRDASAPLIAGVGRLHEQKDFALFLAVAAEVLRQVPAARFVVAGVGPEETALKQQAAALGIAERVRFAGYVSDPRTIYASADVLLLTSRYEGTPLTVLEAMAMQVPVVASRLDGIAEVIEHGVDGILVTPGVREEFAVRVTELLGDPGARERFGRAAREKVIARFSARAMAAQIEGIYDRALAARR